ncbi:O-methylsterigmatocystin oxidoreductase [Coprinopsis sp. MPI-PUGE-AT-0042]|nr:O-methylsterigmatocystin oxidoreductase [Coprinopsis sp. MPI-PUGE-AT-0042]
MVSLLTALSDLPTWLWVTLSFSPFVLRALEKKSRGNTRGLPLPPGPKGIPVFGNMFQIASGKSWETYRNWGETYGGMVYVEVMEGTQLLGPQDQYRFGYTLFDGTMHFSAMALGGGQTVESFTSTSIKVKFRTTTQLLSTTHRSFCRRLAAQPKDFCDIVKYLSGSIIMEITYGVRDPKYTDTLVDDAEAIIAGFGEVSVPGRFLVDMFPILRYIPSWFPGAGWKRRLDGIAAKSRDVYQRTFDDAKERARNGVQSQYPSVAGSLIDKMPPEQDAAYPIQEELARNVILVAYIAGADTTASSGQALFLALAMNPNVQKVAQQELETVVGKLRIPKPTDLTRLPYIRAIVKEVIRWHSVTPLALPHVVEEDDEYNGYFIPQGTIVFGNAWAIMHDPKVYEDPMEFKPERFMKDGELDSSVLDPDAAAFGFGRR